MIAVDILIILIIVYATYTGSRRGIILIGFELFGFVVATLAALMIYHPLGELIKNISGITLALGDVAAFITLWIAFELGVAFVVRYQAMARLPMSLRALSSSFVSSFSGGVLNAVKTMILIILALIIFVGLPVPTAWKQLAADGSVAKVMLAYTGELQQWVAHGLGHDLSDSLNFSTVTNDPESTENIDLGFKTTNFKTDETDEGNMLQLLNHERTSRGLPPLRLNVLAVGVARDHSKDMFTRGYFSHITPEGKNPFDRMTAGGVHFSSAGENLALAPTLQLAEQGLMNSPGHRANILSRDYHSVGIGIMDGGQYGLMITQDFTN